MHVGSDNGVCPRDQDKQDKSFGSAGRWSPKVNPIPSLSSWWNHFCKWPSTLTHHMWPDDSSATFCRLGRYAVESYLEQILSHGFFHADPVSSCCCFWFLVLYYFLKYAYNCPIRTTLWNYKMIPEQKFIVLVYCLCTYIDFVFVFLYLIFNDVQQLCLKACLMEWFSKNLLHTWGNNVSRLMLYRIVPNILKCEFCQKAVAFTWCIS